MITNKKKERKIDIMTSSVIFMKKKKRNKTRAVNIIQKCLIVIGYFIIFTCNIWISDDKTEIGKYEEMNLLISLDYFLLG